MNEPELKTQAQLAEEKKTADILANYEQWSKHPVTKHIISRLRSKYQETANKICEASVKASLPDNIIRQFGIQLNTYAELFKMMTEANSFVGTIPTVKTQQPNT